MGHPGPKSPLILRRKLDRFLVPAAGAAYPIARVEECDKKHETDQESSASGLDVLEEFHADGTPAYGLYSSQGNMAAVEHRKRQHVQHREIDVKHDTKPKHAPPAIFSLEKSFIR